MSSIEDHTSELAALWPALAAALQRDTTGDVATGLWAGAGTVYNADVLTALLALEAQVPETTCAACAALGEPWQARDIPGCLRQLPRVAERMGHLGMAAEQAHVAGRVWDWLRATKRALGLRRPDLPLPGRYRCPHAETCPEDHPGGAVLLCAGDEGFLVPGPDGLQVRWVVSGQIYCPSKMCGASWGHTQWPWLGRLLRQSVCAV